VQRRGGDSVEARNRRVITIATLNVTCSDTEYG
jgi:hypothetical protein